MAMSESHDLMQNKQQRIHLQRKESLNCCSHPIYVENLTSRKNFAKLNFHSCMQEFETEIMEQSSFTVDSGPKSQIKIELSCHSFYDDMYFSMDFGSDFRQLQRRGRGPYFNKLVNSDLDFNLPKRQDQVFKTIKTIAEEIKDWLIWNRGQELIRFVLRKALGAVNRVPDHHNTIRLHFVTIVTHPHVYEEPLSGDCSIVWKNFTKFLKLVVCRVHIYSIDVAYISGC